MKLAKLPDHSPVRITFVATAMLNNELQKYANLYRDTYGEAKPIADLIPSMLEAFIRSDPAFAKTQRKESTGKQVHRGKQSEQKNASKELPTPNHI